MVAGPDGLDLGPDGVHHAGPIRADDVREPILVGEPLQHEEIEVIERGGAERNAHLARAHGTGIRDLGELEMFHAAGPADHPGAHGGARYGMKAGDTICSAPVVGIATGAPIPAAPPTATGWT